MKTTLKDLVPKSGLESLRERKVRRNAREGFLSRKTIRNAVKYVTRRRNHMKLESQYAFDAPILMQDGTATTVHAIKFTKEAVFYDLLTEGGGIIKDVESGSLE